MSYLILWRAEGQPALFDSEEYEGLGEAKAALDDFHARYPWNTYLLVRIEDARQGDGHQKEKMRITWFPAE